MIPSDSHGSRSGSHRALSSSERVILHRTRLASRKARDNAAQASRLLENANLDSSDAATEIAKPTGSAATSFERMRSRRKRLNQDDSNQDLSTEYFHRKFYADEFGYPCGVCDRLWFRSQLTRCMERFFPILEASFGRITSEFKVCATCLAAVRCQFSVRPMDSNIHRDHMACRHSIQ